MHYIVEERTWLLRGDTARHRVRSVRILLLRSPVANRSSYVQSRIRKERCYRETCLAQRTILPPRIRMAKRKKKRRKKKKSTGRVRRDRVLFGARLESFGVSLFRLIDTGCVGIRTAKRQPGSCLSRNALTRFPGKIQRFVDLSRDRGRNVGPRSPLR